MRTLCILMVLLVAACSDTGSEPAKTKSEHKVSGSDAIVFPVISSSPPDSWQLRQLAELKNVDYTAILSTARPVGHHHYLYERRRAGNWIASVWRRGDGTQEVISHLNTKAGAVVDDRRNEAGQIVGVTVAQKDD